MPSTSLETCTPFACVSADSYSFERPKLRRIGPQKLSVRLQKFQQGCKWRLGLDLLAWLSVCLRTLSQRNLLPSSMLAGSAACCLFLHCTAELVLAAAAQVGPGFLQCFALSVSSEAPGALCNAHTRTASGGRGMSDTRQMSHRTTTVCVASVHCKALQELHLMLQDTCLLSAARSTLAMWCMSAWQT